MRYEFKRILGDELRFLAIETRNRLNLTQKEMGDKLQMSESSYSDIETGKSMCGTLTAVLLFEMQDEPEEFLRTVKGKFEKWYEKETRPQ